jgi:hypothetical protein
LVWPSPPEGHGLAIAHYDELPEKKVLAKLEQLSPGELATVEAYERAHQARSAVLLKLHYLGLGGVDAATAEAVRDYENKLRSR